MSRKIVVNPGDIYNMLTVIEEDEPKIRSNGVKRRMFRCLCECGNETVVDLHNLIIGNTKSCGCFRRENSKNLIKNTYEIITTHGDSSENNRKPEYSSWQAMKSRCYYTKGKGYKHYGGRGITVCDRWRNSYENFLEDMGRKPGPEYSIDRINNDGNYEPGNCRWATQKEQVNNQRKLTSEQLSKRSKLAWVNRKTKKEPPQ